MISLIQEYAGKDCLLVLQNLNQIYPFLYDLFNMNYIVKEEKNMQEYAMEILVSNWFTYMINLE